MYICVHVCMYREIAAYLTYKLQIIFHKRATKYGSLLWKMTCKDKRSYESSPPCILHMMQSLCAYIHVRIYTYVQSHTAVTHVLCTPSMYAYIHMCRATRQHVWLVTHVLCTPRDCMQSVSYDILCHIHRIKFSRMKSIWMNHIIMSHTSAALLRIHEGVTSHLWMCHVTHMDVSCHTYRCVMSHL